MNRKAPSRTGRRRVPFAITQESAPRRTRSALIAGILLLGTVTVSGAVFTASLLGDDPVDSAKPPLASCEKSDTLFPGRGKNTLESWKNNYRLTVKDILKAHESPRIAQCTENEGNQPPTQKLSNLAKNLAPWKTTQSQNALLEADMATVLLEYQRMYECALNERLSFLLPSVVAEGKSSEGDIKVAPLSKTLESEQQSIQQELSLTRTVLHRVLSFVGANDRLSPLAQNLECLERASLDIRNALGLAADASACLPRAWDARGSLREY